jgi:hypothetical protein
MLTLNVTQQGAEVIIAALRQLPHSQVHDLVMNLFMQVQQQQQQESVEAVESAQEATNEEVKAGGTD